MKYQSCIFLFCISALHANWSEETLSHMSRKAKIGQLFFIAVQSNPDNTDDPLFKNIFQAFGLTEHHDRAYAQRMIHDFQIGGILYICRGTPETQLKLTNKLQQESTLPLLIMQDFEWGLSMRLDGPLMFPKNKELGEKKRPELVYQLGKEIARQCKLVGVHMNLAPVLDVNNNPQNPIIGPRSFSADPLCVAQLGCSYAYGLRDGGILSCVKHFPGHGDVTINSHVGLPHIAHDRQRLDAVELAPFKTAINNGIPAIMTAHLQVPILDPSGIPTSLSRTVVTDLLRTEFRFDGLIITDGLVMHSVTNTYPDPGDVELKALLAGNDILLFPKDVPAAISKIEATLEHGEVTEEELDQHVLRILRTKEKLGLHVNRFIEEPTDLMRKINSPEAFALQEALNS